MRVSVVVTTYNWPEALLLVLSGLARQTQLPYEVIIADDGSGMDTRRALERVAPGFPCALRHYWQEDLGFRAARCRNGAIAAASGDYLLLLDGDMIPDRRFVQDHLRFARPGSFVQGSRALTSPTLASYMIRHDVIDLTWFTPHLARRRNAMHSRTLAWSYIFLSRRRLRGVKSCNQGWYRSDLLRINGFDERMVGWGREDSELAERACNAGIILRHLRFSALAWHLSHPERHIDGASRNEQYLLETRMSGKIWADLGLSGHGLREHDSKRALPDLRDLMARPRAKWSFAI